MLTVKYIKICSKVRCTTVYQTVYSKIKQKFAQIHETPSMSKFFIVNKSLKFINPFFALPFRIFVWMRMMMTTITMIMMLSRVYKVTIWRCWLIFSNDRIAWSRRLCACDAVSIVQLLRKERNHEVKAFFFVRFVCQVYHFALIQYTTESIAFQTVYSWVEKCTPKHVNIKKRFTIQTPMMAKKKNKKKERTKENMFRCRRRPQEKLSVC